MAELRGDIREKFSQNFTEPTAISEKSFHEINFAEATRNFVKLLNINPDHGNIVHGKLKKLLDEVQKATDNHREIRSADGERPTEIGDPQASIESRYFEALVEIEIKTDIFGNNNDIVQIDDDTLTQNFLTAICKAATDNKDCDIAKGLKTSFGSGTSTAAGLRDHAEKFAKTAIKLRKVVFQKSGGEQEVLYRTRFPRHKFVMRRA